jgi:hypothetical protein
MFLWANAHNNASYIVSRGYTTCFSDDVTITIRILNLSYGCNTNMFLWTNAHNNASYIVSRGYTTCFSDAVTITIRIFIIIL